MSDDRVTPKMQAFQDGRNGVEAGWHIWKHDPELFEAYQSGMAECEKFGPPDISPSFIRGF